MDGLRDPIWPGIEAVLGIAIVLINLIRYFADDDFKWWVDHDLRQSKPLKYAIVAAVVIFFCAVTAQPLNSVAHSIMATSTPTPTRTRIPTFTPTATLVPTETPVPTPAYTYLVYDNFDSRPLPQWSPEYGTWQMVNDRYMITNITDDANWASGLTFIGDPLWTNYEVGANVHLVNVTPRINVAYVIVRALDRNNYLLLEIRDYDLFDSDWSRGVWYVVQNGEKIEKAVVGFNSPLASDFVLLIQVQDDIVTTFIDGKQVSRWGDVPYLNGMAGLGVYSRYPTDPVSFDEFFIRTQP